MRVRELADYLRDDHNFDIALDQYMLPAGPADGWPHWSEAQVREADYVLVVSTARYCCHYELRESPRIGLGSVCEARLIHQELYNAGGMNEKFRVIHFVEDENEHVPDTLQAYHRYRLYETASKNEMIAWLHGQSSDRRFAAAAARITLEEAHLLASAGKGMPGLIQVLLENVARDKRPEAAGASAR